MMNIKKEIFSSIRLRQIINDLKRRPEDASKDLKIKYSVFNRYLSGKKRIDEQFVKKAVNIWPVNISDFINPYYQKTKPFKIMRAKDSIKTKRVMKRGGKDYYEYRDTVMDKDAPFRPEWIRELVHVTKNNPNDKSLMWNRGHLLHQLTYFVGKVNFYYIDKNNKKRVAAMNTGDSMYIAPYVPHTFASREKKCEGYIIAITFSDKITTQIQNEVSTFKNQKIKQIIFKKKFKKISKVTIKKNKKKINYSGPIQIIKLAENKIIPSTKFFELNVRKNNSKNFTNNYHQYIYVLSNQAKLKIENKKVNLKKVTHYILNLLQIFVCLQKKQNFLLLKLKVFLSKTLSNNFSILGKTTLKDLKMITHNGLSNKQYVLFN